MGQHSYIPTVAESSTGQKGLLPSFWGGSQAPLSTPFDPVNKTIADENVFVGVYFA